MPVLSCAERQGSSQQRNLDTSRRIRVWQWAFRERQIFTTDRAATAEFGEVGAGKPLTSWTRGGGEWLSNLHLRFYTIIVRSPGFCEKQIWVWESCTALENPIFLPDHIKHQHCTKQSALHRPLSGTVSWTPLMCGGMEVEEASVGRWEPCQVRKNVGLQHQCRLNSQMSERTAYI